MPLSHAPLDAIVELVETHDLAPAEVRRVRIGLSDAGYDLIAQPEVADYSVLSELEPAAAMIGERYRSCS